MKKEKFSKTSTGRLPGLPEASRKLKLYNLVNSETREIETKVYMTDEESEVKNRGYATNRISKKYILA